MINSATTKPGDGGAKSPTADDGRTATSGAQGDSKGKEDQKEGGFFEDSETDNGAPKKLFCN